MSTIPNGISSYTIEKRILLDPNDAAVEVKITPSFDFSVILSPKKKARLDSFVEKYKQFCEPKVKDYESQYRKSLAAIKQALRNSKCDIVVAEQPFFHCRSALSISSRACRRSFALR